MMMMARKEEEEERRLIMVERKKREKIMAKITMIREGKCDGNGENGEDRECDDNDAKDRENQG